MRLRFFVFGVASIVLAGCQTQPTKTGVNADPDASGMPMAKILNVADAAIAGGDPKMALAVSQSVLKADPHNISALQHEGDAYYALNLCMSANASYHQVLVQDPTPDEVASQAETGIGRCFLRTDPKAALNVLTTAIKDDPTNADAFNDLGIAYDLSGDPEQAAGPYESALRIDPSMSAAEVNLGMSLVIAGKGNEALQYLGPLATSADANSKVREDYAAALVSVGRIDEATRVLSIDLPPDQVHSAIEGFSSFSENLQTMTIIK
jgi:Flp pilus assembly protein TadD